MPGYTLIELVAVLTLFGVGAAGFAPTARRLSDRATVATVGEEVVGLLLEGRTVALARGGSTVTIASSPASVRVDAGPVLVRAATLDRSVAIRLGAGRDSVRLRFDALGLGRFTSQTIVLSRGDATRSLLLSSYGRIRRR